MISQSTHDAGRAWFQAMRDADKVRVFPGRLVAGGEIEYYVSNDPGKIWVSFRMGDEVVSVATATNLGVALDHQQQAIADWEDGELVIRAPVARFARERFGMFASSAAVPPHTASISGGGADYVESARFMPGLVVADTSGLWVTVKAHWIDGALIPDTRVLLTPTATSGKTGYVLVGRDNTTGVIDEYAAADEDTATVGAVQTVIAANTGVFFYGAFPLSNGDTDIVQSKLLDLRFFQTPSVFYQMVQEEGVDVTQRGVLNFKSGTGVTVSVDDNSGDGSTDVTVSLAAADVRYFAVYNYRNGTEPKIGYATSADRRTWTRVTEPLLTFGSGGAQDDTHLAHPCIVEDDKGVLHLYYGGYSGTNYAVMLARSFDYGTTWTKYGTVLSSGVAWENGTVSWARVLYDRAETDSAKRWKMWYIGDSGVGGIGYAYSADGLSWTKFASNPVVALGSGGTWDDAALETGDIIRLGDVYYLFYGGTDALVNPTWSVGYVTFTDPEGTYTRSADNPILTGDSISQDVSTNIALNDTSIHVASATVFPIGAPVWIYDNSSVTNKMLTTVTERIDSTHIRIADPAIHTFATAQTARVRSAAYNSVVPIRVIYDKGWLFTVTAFQPEFWTSNIHEISMFAFGKDLSQLYLDYGAGMILPITADESDLSDVSFENPYIYDRWRYGDRTQVYQGDPTAIHTDVAGEIAGLTQKATPVSGDFLVIEDSAASNVKKYVTVGDLPTGSFAGDAFDVPYTPTTSGDWSTTPTEVGGALDTLAADVAALGSGSSPYTAPPTTGWSWLNQGTSTIDSATARQYLEAPANATFQVRGRYRDQPTVPYTITAAFKGVALDNNAHFGFLWYDGTTEVMTFGASSANSGTDLYRTWYKWTDFDTLNSNYFNAASPLLHLNPLWLKIEDDNTNIKVYYSADGENFIELSSQTRTNWLTPSKVGFFVAPGATNKASVTLLSWEEA